MDLNFPLILGTTPVALTFIKNVFLYFKKKKITSVNEWIGDMFHFLLYVCGVYAGLLVLYYGMSGEPFPEAETYIVLATLIIGGSIIILVSIKSIIERFKLTREQRKGITALHSDE